MSSDVKGWIQKLVDEDKARRDAEASRMRLTEKIRAEARGLMERILEVVQRDVATINRELYGGEEVLTVHENTSDNSFIVSKETETGANMHARINSREHALVYTLTLYQGPDSYADKHEPEAIAIIPGQDINDLHFSKSGMKLSLEGISQRLIEPVVRAGEPEQGESEQGE